MITIESSTHVSAETLVEKLRDDPEAFAEFLDVMQDSVTGKDTIDAAEHMTKDQAETIRDFLKEMAGDLQDFIDEELS